VFPRMHLAALAHFLCLQDPSSDFRKHVQEHVKLHGCYLKDVENSLVFEIQDMVKLHSFTAKGAAEKKTWLDSLNDSITRYNKAVDQVTCALC
jgi:hypothetical protein